MSISLTQPSVGSTDWGVAVNTNWQTLMDTLNGGSQTLGYLTYAGLAAPAVSPAGQGRIYFDSSANKFKMSENNGAFVNLGSGSVTAVTATAPLASSGGATPDISLSGTIPVANGGTGLATITSGAVMTGNGTGNVALVGPGTTGQMLISNGSVLSMNSMSGDATLASGGALTIAANAVTDAKLRDSTALSVLGRSANSSGDPADIAASAASGAVLRESGSVLGFGTIATAGIADSAVTFAKMQDVGAPCLLGRDSSGTGPPMELTVGGGIEFTVGGIQTSDFFGGDVTKPSGSTVLTIVNDAVTNAKIANATIDLTTKVTGTLPVANGGTGLATITSGAVMTGNGAGNVVLVGPGTTGQLLISDGSALSMNTVSGDATLAAGGALTIAANAVSNAKLRQGGALTVIGRSTNSLGNVADIAAIAASGAVLRESGSVLEFGTVATAGIANDAVTTAKILNANVTAAKMVNSGVFTGDATSTFPALTIGNLAITNAKIANTTINLTTKVTGALPIANGGTGQTTALAAFNALSPVTTRGDMIYRGASDNVRLVVGANNRVLRSNGTDPVWGQVALTTDISGTLPVANGGTNSSTALNNNRIMVSSGGSIAESGSMTNGQLLVGQTSAAPAVKTISGDATLSLNGVVEIPRLSGNIVINGGFDMAQRGTQLGSTLSGNTHSNTTIDGLSSTANLRVGMTVAGSGVAGGTTISSITSATAIIISAATSSTLTGTSLIFGLASNTYCLDRWYVLTQTSGVQVERGTGDTNSPYAAKITQTQSSAQRIGIGQVVESVNSLPLRGRNVIFQMRVKVSASAQTVRCAVLEWTGSADSSITRNIVNDWDSTDYGYGSSKFFKDSAFSLKVVANGSVSPTASTWTNLSVSALFDSDTTMKNIIVFVWVSGTQSQNATFEVTQAGLYDGSAGRDWLPRPIQQELALCRRYCYGWEVNNGSTAIGRGWAYSQTGAWIWIPGARGFRQVPTKEAGVPDDFELDPGQGGSIVINVFSGPDSTLSTPDDLLFGATATNSNFTANRPYAMRFRTGAVRRLVLSAEL